mgnify:CR=1 FL=1
MVLRALVETGFILALNPRDRHHKWAIKVLEEVKRGEVELYISPVAPVELSLIMRARGHGDEDVCKVLKATESIVRRYSKPQYPQLGLGELAYAAELRMKYVELAFFDSIHAAVTIANDLTYYDLDEIIKSVVVSEVRR